jgi:hypothetical protein
MRRGSKGHVPKSRILKTPGTLELCLRVLASLASLGGLEERPWTAESTLLRGLGAASADMMIDGVLRIWGLLESQRPEVAEDISQLRIASKEEFVWVWGSCLRYSVRLSIFLV